jgi:hypothetical protein
MDSMTNSDCASSARGRERENKKAGPEKLRAGENETSRVRDAAVVDQNE